MKAQDADPDRLAMTCVHGGRHMVYLDDRVGGVGPVTFRQMYLVALEYAEHLAEGTDDPAATAADVAAGRRVVETERRRGYGTMVDHEDLLALRRALHLAWSYFQENDYATDGGGGDDLLAALTLDSFGLPECWLGTPTRR